MTVEEITAACDKHVEKQRAAMLSTTMRPDRDSGLGKILSARMKNPPQGKEWQEANAALKKIDAKLAKRTPNDRHGERMTALYVEPRSATEWNRPADKSAKEAFEFLVDAINDYRGPYHRHRIGSVESTMLLEDDPELYRVLEQMADRPTLWCPINPSWPG